MTPYIYFAYMFQLYSQTIGEKKNEIAGCTTNVWGYKEILHNGISVANVTHWLYDLENKTLVAQLI